MRRILIGTALAALIATPTLAQDYHKNFAECAKELGLNQDPSYNLKLHDGRTIRRWYLHSEAQQAVFNDCLSRKASLAAKPSTKEHREPRR